MPPQNPQEPQNPSEPVPQGPLSQANSQPQAGISPQPVPNNTDSHPKKRFPKWLKIIGIIFLAFILIMGIVAVVATSATKAPQKVSDQFVNDVQSGDTSAAYALTSKSFKDATDEDQLDKLIKQVSPALQGEEKVTSRAIEKSTGVPQTAVIVYDVKTSNGTKYIKIELQKDGDDWKVVNFRSSDTPLDTKVE